MLIGFAYTLPPVDIWSADTYQGAPDPEGTANGMGVYAGIGVLDVVAVTPSPTSIYASVLDQTITPCGPAAQVPVAAAVPVYAAVLAGYTV